MLNKFGECAKLAVELLQNGKIKNPVLAWEKAAFFTFPNSSSSRKKCCPKNAFLTICETGRVKGVPAGIYCGDRVKENKNYALKIMDLLKNNSEFANNKQKLWKFVCGDSKITSTMDKNPLNFWFIGFEGVGDECGDYIDCGIHW